MGLPTNQFNLRGRKVSPVFSYYLNFAGFIIILLLITAFIYYFTMDVLKRNVEPKHY